MTGSLQTKNGKYYAVINLSVDGKRKQKWICSGLEVHNNKKRAEQFLRDTIKEYELKSDLVQSDILFSDYVYSWLEHSKHRLDPVTYQGYLSIANSHIIPYFKDLGKSLDKVTRVDIQKYVDFKFENGKLNGSGGLSSKSVRTHMIVIHQAFEDAIKNNLILTNPCKYVALPKKQRIEPNFYTLSELQSMFSALKDEPLYPLIYFTVVYGLRRSEVLGLKWDSVNFENKIITIKHTVVRQNGVFEKDCTKNNSSYRSYPLTDEVKVMLEDFREKENANRALFGKEYINNDYIFKWDNGKTYSPDYISKKFSQLLKKNGLRHIRFHDLRHNCASLLVANGFTLKDIQEWLGHADIQTTANIYSHLDVERKKNIAFSLSESVNN